MADQGKRGGQPQHPVIQVPRWVDIGPLPDGKFEKEITFNVVYGKWPAQDVTCRFMVGSEVVGGPVFVGADGLITAKCKLKGPEPEVIAEIRSQRTGSMYSRLLGKVPVPVPKRKVVVVDHIRNGDVISAVLRRTGKDGKSESGDIAFWDWEKRADVYELSLQVYPQEAKEEFIIVDFFVLEKARRIEFFLPDDQTAERCTLNVPSLALQPATPKELELLKGFRAGREKHKEKKKST